jgi:hypothetical protein
VRGRGRRGCGIQTALGLLVSEARACRGSACLTLRLAPLLQSAPAIPSDGKFSVEFCDFISKCCVKDAQKRPSVHEISNHSFLQLHKGTSLTDLLTGKPLDP